MWHQFILSQRLPIDVLSGSKQNAINVLRARYVFNWFAKPATTDICGSGRFTDLFGRLLNIPSWHNSVQSAPHVACFECWQATLTSQLSGDKFPTYLPLPQTVYLKSAKIWQTPGQTKPGSLLARLRGRLDERPWEWGWGSPFDDLNHLALDSESKIYKVTPGSERVKEDSFLNMWVKYLLLPKCLWLFVLLFSFLLIIPFWFLICFLLQVRHLHCHHSIFFGSSGPQI